VWFQPVVDLRSGRMCGVEALLRKRNRRTSSLVFDAGGIVANAEADGTVHALGRQALEAACELAAGRPDLDQIRINLSAQEIDRSLVPGIVDVFERHGTDPSRMVFELTETIPLELTDDVVGSLRALRETGAGLELDDFGIGHNSLLRLDRLPVSGIKIDRVFVEGCGDGTVPPIVRSIIELGHELDLTVTAEGIEHAEQSRMLQALGCRHGQGWLYGRAMPAPALPSAEWRASTATQKELA
jgi:EAL domain-containing protein (putative c-di-GMP-specific phosphodiesterase class I)